MDIKLSWWDLSVLRERGSVEVEGTTLETTAARTEWGGQVIDPHKRRGQHILSGAEIATGNAIAFDQRGDIYLYGMSQDGGGDLPVVNPIEGYFSGNKMFIAAFSPNATQLLFSTRLGDTSATAVTGEQPIANNGLALDATGNIYFAGQTADSGNLVTTPGTYTTNATSSFLRGFFGKISPVFAADTTVLTISPSTATAGQNVTFSVRVAGTTQTTPAPSGTVTLTNTSTSPATVLGTITLDGTGAGTLSTSSLAVGTYSVTASYPGDGNYAVSTSTAQPLTVNSVASSTTALTVLPGASLTYGQAVTLTATVTQSATGIPTGTVTFTEGSLVLGTVPLNGSGLAMLTNTPPSGIGTFVATYNGSAIAPASASSGAPVSVAKAVLTVTANNAGMIYGQPVPPFTNTITGFVNSDPSAVVSGTATESTTVTPTSIPGGYPITFSATSLAAANYTFNYVNGTLTISGGAAQSITFNPLPNLTLGAAPFALTATASSGLAVSFVSTTMPLCTVSGASVTLVATGICTIQATQPGNNLYAAATPVSRSFSILAATNKGFTITPIPALETLYPGLVGGFILRLNSDNGFSGKVTLSCSGGPAGTRCIDSPQTLMLKGTAYALSAIQPPSNSAPGTYTVTFTGVSGSLTSTATAKLTIK